MSLLDTLFGIRTILSGGVKVFDAQALNFGGGLSALYNAVDKRIDVSGAAGAAGWFVLHTATADVTAVSHDFVQVTPAAATTVVTAPPAAAGAYFGVQLCGSPNGKIVEVRKPDTTLLATLNVDDESIWFVYDAAASAWRVHAWNAPEPALDARISPLACWLSAGADVNLTDLSGGGHALPKNGTIVPSVGYNGRLASGWASQYLLTDAAFRLTGAVSYEVLACPIHGGINNGTFIQCGTGSGSTQNQLWSLLWVNDANAVPRWTHRQQNGTNVNSDLTGPQVITGWQHIVVTRAANGTTAKIYLNGVLANTGTLTAATGGSASQVVVGGTSSNQPRASQQFWSVWSSELTAAQASYLAATRLGKRRLP